MNYLWRYFIATNPRRITAALRATYPALSPEDAASLARELASVIDTGLAEKWAFGNVRLMASGGKVTPLGLALQNLRKKARLSQKAVAEHADWSHSKMVRIENGTVGISVTSLRALMDLYGLHDAKQRAHLENLARQGYRQRRD